MEPNGVWLTDRSRIWRGRTHCKRARYLEYHSGPFGYGIRRRAESLPLVTGSAVHELLANLIQTQPSQEGLRALVNNARDAYQKRCAARGFLELERSDDPEQEMQRAELRRVIAEQSALVEAIGWAAGRLWIPLLLEEFEPVLVEEEIELQIADDLVLMLRPDLIARRRVDGALVQFEFKTVGGYTDSPFWTKQWQHSAQLTLTKIGASARLGEDVGFAYIYGIDKGRRSAEKATGLDKQWSPLLYAYHKPAQPPYEPEDWQTRYEWTDGSGASRRLGRSYKRESVFDYPFVDLPAGVSSTEFWVHSLPPEELARVRLILGPYQFLLHAEQSILTGVVSEENEWIERLWRIHEVGERVGWEEAHPDFVDVLDREVPQSWNCHPFGHDCPFLPICDRQPGWERPLESGAYELRRPHHAPELEQIVARGIELPADQDEEENE